MYSNLKSGSRKALAVLLSILMVLSLLPISVLAESLKADNLENGTIDFAIAGFDGETELEQVTTATLTVTKDGEAVYSKEASGATMEVPFAEVENYLTAEYDWVISAPTYDDYALNVSDLSVTEVVMVKLQATFYTVSADEDGNSENVKFADGFTGRVRAGESVKFTIETSQKDPQKVYTSEFYYTMGDKLFNVEPDKEITTEPATGDIKVYAVVQENNIGIDFEVAANSWTNDNSIDVSANDSDYELYYSTSADGSNKQSAPIALSTQGENTFYVWGEKTTGLIFKKVTKSDVVEYKVKYDNSDPVVDSATLKAGEENYEAGAWANEDVTLSAVVSDAYSGVKTVELYNSKSEKVDTKDVTDGTYTYTFAVESNKALNDTFTLKVIDSVGLVDDSYTAAVKIDKAKPVISNVSYKAGDAAYSGAWVNQDVVLTADVADADSGIEKVAVYQGDTFVADMIHQSGDSYSYTFSVETGKALEGSYTIKAIDKMDNAQTTSAQDVKIDKINPEVTFAVEQENTDNVSRFFNKFTFGLFFNPDVKITLNPTDDNSGVASTTLILERDGVKKEYTATDNTFKIDAEIAKNDFGIEDLTAAEFKFSISAKVADNAGNEILNKPDQFSFEEGTAPNDFMLENVVPTTDLKVGETAYDELGDTWLSDNAALTIGAQDANSGIFKVEVKDLNDLTGGEPTAYTYKYGAKEENPVNTKAEEIKLNTSFFKYNAQNGTYNFTVQVMDNCGNVSALATYEIKKDLNAPQITNIEYAAAKATDSKLSYDPALIKNEEGYFGYFFKEATEVTLSVSDSLFGEKSSGIADVVVKLVDFEGNETTPELNKADLSNVTFTVAAGFKGYIFAYAVDNAGNSTVKEDGTAADISYEGKAGTDFAGTDGENALANRDAYNTSEGATNWVSAEYAQKVVLSAEATEFTAYNGWISAYGLIAETQEQHTTDHKEEAYQNDGEWILIKASADNHVALYRQAADFDHAQTNPDTLFYQNDVKLKVVVKDTFNGIRSANVTFTPADKFGGYNAAFSIDDAALASRVPDEIVDGWTVVSNKENLVTEISKEITVPAETAQEYTFIEYTAEMTDMSGNESDVSDSFSVDVTAPEAPITVNGEAYATTDEKWYADNVEIAIQAKDGEDVTQSGLYTVQVLDLNNGEKLVKEYTYGKSSLDNRPNSSTDTFNTADYTTDGSGNKVADLVFDTVSSAYKFKVVVYDNCGNFDEKTYTVKKDINAPEITDITFAYDAIDKNLEGAEYTPQVIRNEGNDFGFFIQKDTTVTIKTDDSLLHEECSGTKEVVVKLYDIKTKEETELSLTPNDICEVSFDIKAGFKGYIYAYAVDGVGNSTVKEDGKAAVISYQGKEGSDFIETDTSHANRNTYNFTEGAVNWVSSTYAEKLRLTEAPQYEGYASAYGIISETETQHQSDNKEDAYQNDGEWILIKASADNHVALYRQAADFDHAQTDPDTLFYQNDVKLKVVVKDTFNGIRSANVTFTPADKFGEYNAAFSIDDAALASRVPEEVVDGWTVVSNQENLVTEISKEITVAADVAHELTFAAYTAEMTDMSGNKSEVSSSFSVDVTAPEAPITVNGEAYATTDEKWYADNVEIAIQAKDGEDATQSGLYTVQVFDLNNLDEKDNPQLAKEYTYGKSSLDNRPNSSTDTFNTADYTTDGSGNKVADLVFDTVSSAYKFKVVVYDNCGNFDEKTYTVKKDLNAPQITDITFTPASDSVDERLAESDKELTPQLLRNKENYYGFFFKNDTTVTMTISDSLLSEQCSGIKQVVVKILSVEDPENPREETVNYEAPYLAQQTVSFNIDAGFKGYIYAYAVDAVDNSTCKGGLASDLSFANDTTFVNTDPAEGIEATDAHANRNTYNLDGAVNWISKDYEATLRKTENPLYAGYVSAYGLILESQEEHEGHIEAAPEEIITADPANHIVIQRQDTDLENQQGDLYDGDVTVTVTITDTKNGIRDARIEFGNAVDMDAEEFSAHAYSFDISEVSLDGANDSSWEIKTTETNLVTQISKTFIFDAEDYETNGINYTVYMTDMGLNESEVSDQFSIDITVPTVQIVELGRSSAGTGDEGFYNYNRKFRLYVTDANFYPSNNEAIEHYNSDFMFELQHKGYDDKAFSVFKHYGIDANENIWKFDENTKQYGKGQRYYFEYTADKVSGGYTGDGEYRFSEDCFAQDCAMHVSNNYAGSANQSYLPAYTAANNYTVVNNTVKGIEDFENNTYYNLNHFYIDKEDPEVVMNLTDGVGTYQQNIESIDYFQTDALQYDITLNDAGSKNGATTANYATYFNASGDGAFRYTVDSSPEAGVINNIALASRVSTASYNQDATSDYDSFDFLISYKDRAGNSASYTYTSGGANDFAGRGEFVLTKACPDIVKPEYASGNSPAGRKATQLGDFDTKFAIYDKNLSTVTHSLNVDSWYNKDAKALTVAETVEGGTENKQSTIQSSLLKNVIKIDNKGTYDSTLSYSVSAKDRANNEFTDVKGEYASIDGRGSFFYIEASFTQKDAEGKEQKLTFPQFYNNCVKEVRDSFVFTEYSVLKTPSTLHIEMKDGNGVYKNISTTGVTADTKIVSPPDTPESVNESYTMYATTWTIPAEFFNQFKEQGQFVDCDYCIYVTDAEGQNSYLVGSGVGVDNITDKTKITNNTKNAIKQYQSLHFALDNEAPVIEVAGEDADAILDCLKYSNTDAVFEPDKVEGTNRYRELRLVISDKSFEWLKYSEKYKSDDTLKDEVLNSLLPDETSIVSKENGQITPEQISIEADKVIFVYRLYAENEDYTVSILGKDEAGNKTNLAGDSGDTITASSVLILVSASRLVRLWSNISNWIKKNTAITIIIGAVVLAAIAAAIIIPVLRKRDEDPEEAEE